MLFAMLDSICQGLDAGVAADALPAYIGVWREQRPEFFAELNDRLAPVQADRVTQLIAAFSLTRIRDIPAIAAAMRTILDEDRVHPAVRCALIGSLAYLVQPRDLLPDDLPGGYGWLDDCMILRTTLGEYFDLLPADLTQASERYGGERQVLQVLAMCLPSRRLFLVQGALDGVWHLFQRLLALPAEQARDTATQLIQDPLGARLPLQGFTAPYGPAPDITRPPGGAAVALHGDGVSIALLGGAVVRLP